MPDLERQAQFNPPEMQLTPAEQTIFEGTITSLQGPTHADPMFQLTDTTGGIIAVQDLRSPVPLLLEARNQANPTLASVGMIALRHGELVRIKSGSMDPKERPQMRIRRDEKGVYWLEEEATNQQWSLDHTIVTGRNPTDPKSSPLPFSDAVPITTTTTQRDVSRRQLAIRLVKAQGHSAIVIDNIGQNPVTIYAVTTQ